MLPPTTPQISNKLVNTFNNHPNHNYNILHLSPPSPSSQRVPDGHQEIKALDQSFSSTIVRDPLSLVGISARLVIEDLLRRYLLVCAGAIWDC